MNSDIPKIFCYIVQGYINRIRVRRLRGDGVGEGEVEVEGRVGGVKTRMRGEGFERHCVEIPALIYDRN
mgnify:CR=1 FL=1